MLLPLLLLSCSDGEAPEAPESPEATQPAPEPTPPSAVAQVWSAQNIAQLNPEPASRESKTPAVLAPSEIYTTTLAILGAIVDAEATDPGNPWAIGHGMLARGAGMKLSGDQDAVDWLFSEYAEEYDAGGTTLIRFPRARGDIRIEPHTDLILKALTEARVDPQRIVTVGGNPHPVADLYRSSLLSTYLDPYKNHSSFDNPNDVPWSVQALTAWAPGDLTWLALDGTAMKLTALVGFNVAVLDSETKFLAEAMRSGADFDRQGQAIFQYTCGGAHLLQGAAMGAARFDSPPALKATVTKQVDLMFYRLPRELAIYDAAIKRLGPRYATKLMVQRLKFTGHFLESMHKLAAMGYYTPTPEQVVLLEGTAKQVALVVQGLEKSGVLNDLAAIRAEDEQLYLDIVGDSAHAIRGLELALGQRGVFY
ncbi:MAG: hypothetical protein ACI8RZ_002928 [Myxococcota bacterium]|jgi:hypothetical protein